MSADPHDYKDRCPRFMCNDIESEKESFSRYLSEQVFCFKSDFYEPLDVHLKDCSRVGYQPGHAYDVFGNPFREGQDRTQFCHGKLNRCMADPYAKMSDRLPGDMCEVNYQCSSQYCNIEKRVCEVIPINDESRESDSPPCASHEDCNPGLYCESSPGPLGSCQKQRGLGEPCDSEYACENHLGCLNR